MPASIGGGSGCSGSLLLPPLHVAPAAHFMPQAPQLFASCFVLEQLPPQQAWSPLQVLPQAPQFFASFIRSNVSSTVPLQSSSMLLQVSLPGVAAETQLSS